MAIRTIPTSSDIYLEVNGKKVAVVQSYSVQSTKSSTAVEQGQKRLSSLQETAAQLDGQFREHWRGTGSRGCAPGKIPHGPADLQ